MSICYLKFSKFAKIEYLILIFHKKISSTFIFYRYYSATKSPSPPWRDLTGVSHYRCNNSWDGIYKINSL